MTTEYATHCPLCGSGLDEDAEAYDTRVQCSNCGELDIEVWRPSGQS